jgi:hypothetical protein
MHWKTIDWRKANETGAWVTWPAARLGHLVRWGKPKAWGPRRLPDGGERHPGQVARIAKLEHFTANRVNPAREKTAGFGGSAG